MTKLSKRTPYYSINFSKNFISWGEGGIFFLVRDVLFSDYFSLRLKCNYLFYEGALYERKDSFLCLMFLCTTLEVFGAKEAVRGEYVVKVSSDVSLETTKSQHVLFSKVFGEDVFKTQSALWRKVIFG